MLFLSTEEGTMVSGQLPDYLDFSHGVDAADIDGDIDIRVGSWPWGDSANKPYFVINDGTGEFTVQHVPTEHRDGYAPAEFFDADGDGDVDFFVGDDAATPATGILYVNDGRGAFVERAQEFPVGLFGSETSVEITLAFDYDSDGDLDLFVAQQLDDSGGEGGAIQVLQNDGLGWFVDVTEAVLPHQHKGGGMIHNIYAANVNADGLVDLIASRFGPGDGEMLWLSNGDDTFTVFGPDELMLEGGFLTVLDYDHDGVGELVTFSRNLSHFEDLTIRIYEFG
ncbi:VCBS repeat-containing protein [Roseibium sp.]|uniref:FG-GAP repeat domain-containing protein n=1 Tax=Roseibium sp. TaxID=1936156 RepID=UPI003297A3E0